MKTFITAAITALITSAAVIQFTGNDTVLTQDEKESAYERVMHTGVLAVDISEHKLQKFLNSAVEELVNSGSYHRILAPYSEKYPNAFTAVK